MRKRLRKKKREEIEGKDGLVKKKTFEIKRTNEIRSKILYNFNMLLSQKEMGRKKY